jgi:hypothetical protein
MPTYYFSPVELATDEHMQDEFTWTQYGTVKVQTLDGIYTVTEFLESYRIVDQKGKTMRVTAYHGMTHVKHVSDVVVDLFAQNFAAQAHIVGDYGQAADYQCRGIDPQTYGLDAGRWVTFGAIEYGDYSGGSVQRSNVEFMLKEFGEKDPANYWHQEITGAHGYRAVAVRGEYAGELCEHFKRLESYGLLDEDLHSELEHSSYVHARADYLRESLAYDLGLERDAVTALVDRINDDQAVDELLELRDNTSECTGENWYFQPDCTHKKRPERLSKVRSMTTYALVELAMSHANTITLPSKLWSGWDVQLRRRAGKVRAYSRRWGRRDWRPCDGAEFLP